MDSLGVRAKRRSGSRSEEEEVSPCSCRESKVSFLSTLSANLLHHIKPFPPLEVQEFPKNLLGAPSRRSSKQTDKAKSR
jgi:hypothetical protein